MKHIRFKLIWQVLLVIKSGDNIKTICQKVQINATNGTRIIKKLESNYLVIVKKMNRERTIHLTLKGSVIQNHLKEIDDLMRIK